MMKIRRFLCFRFRAMCLGMLFFQNVFLSFWGQSFILAQGRRLLKKFLSGSQYQLPIWPTSDQRTIKKVKYLVRFQLGQMVNIPGSTEQILWMQEASPKWVPKILPSQGPEPPQKITKRKKDLDNSLTASNSGKTLATSGVQPTFLSSHIQLQMRYNPHFCPATFWRAPHLTFAKPSF